MKQIASLSLLIVLLLSSCVQKDQKSDSASNDVVAATPFTWEAATIYFLLTDRFHNGDTSNDVNFNRSKETAVLRGFEGGDIKGITQKIEEGYFNELGVDAIWMTPIVEQIHGGTDEGTGYTYGYHGYWTKDWTALDPNFGTAEDLKTLVKTAHKNGIRILLDAVINHTGPVTEIDTVWPEEWIRTSPKCAFDSYENTIVCTLVANLPDIKTESDAAVDLPPQLVEKWKSEGRYEQEVAELDAFFEKTGYPRAPRFYVMKWLADYITDFGIDGYRVDTVKHTEEFVWEEFEDVCEAAFADWKENNKDQVLDNSPFYLVGEVYNYSVNSNKYYDFGDKKVDYFNDSFNALINFDLRWDGDRPLEAIYSNYSNILNNELDGFSTLSYITSHDDGSPFDKERKRTYESAIRLLLAPGAAQIYYGDESARSLLIDGTNGDATLRSNMNWEDIASNEETQKLLEHWRKLGKFRQAHPAIGAGVHQMLNETPYTFSRTWDSSDYQDKVLIGLDLNTGPKKLAVAGTFKDGTLLYDGYSDQEVQVENGEVLIDSEFNMVLLAPKK